MTRAFPIIPIEFPSIATHTRFICYNYDTTPADLFVKRGSFENPTVVVALCFEFYIHERK